MLPPPKSMWPQVTNIRNTSSPRWRDWPKSEKPEPNPDNQKKDVVWFALHDDRPLTAFAGIWTTFNGDRGIKAKPVPGPHKAYGFLTTPRNRAAKAGLNLQGPLPT